MLSFYAFPEALRVAFSLLAVLSAALAALVLVLHQYRFKRDLAYWLGGALAFLVLCQAVVNAALLARAQHNMQDGFIVPSGFAAPRYAVFIAVAAVSLLLCIKAKRLFPGVAFLASLLTLPCAEAWAGRAFPALFIASVLVLLSSSAWLSLKIRGELAASVSGLSVKQAMDSLGDGILFYGANGSVLMLNSKMRELMLQTTGGVVYNGRLFLEALAANAEPCGEDGWLYKFPESEWLFTAGEIRLGRRRVTRVTAADVTGLNRETRLLRETQAALEGQQKRLRAFVRDIEAACREDALLRVKAELHGAHNGKLTTLLQYLRYRELPEGSSFEEIRESVLRSIAEPKAAPASPEDILAAMVGQYGRKGVEIRLAGALPGNREIALALIKILREAAANAVTHGCASEVYAQLTDEGGSVALRVTDNSALPAKEIREGGGIAEMRGRAERLGGSLTAGYMPGFTLTVRIPLQGGESNA
jgi:hypothetical protein